MKKLLLSVFAVTLLAVTAISEKSEAALLTTINTGEASYDVLAPGAGSAVAASNIVRHPNWAMAPGSSSWIGISNGDTTDPVGDYTFSLDFDLTGYDASTAAIAAQVAVDNSAQFFLNGNNLNINVAGFGSLTGFVIDDFFVAGINTLEIIVNNANCNGCLNPMGLLIANSEVAISAVPLPAALPLYGAGILALGFLAKRRKNRA